MKNQKIVKILMLMVLSITVLGLVGCAQWKKAGTGPGAKKCLSMAKDLEDGKFKTALSKDGNIYNAAASLDAACGASGKEVRKAYEKFIDAYLGFYKDGKIDVTKVTEITSTTTDFAKAYAESKNKKEIAEAVTKLASAISTAIVK